jgi:hypothetical protein
LVGVVIGFGADSLIGASNNGMVSLDKSIALTAILLTTGIIAANIAATVFFHMLSPENRRRMAQETARDKIEAASLKAIEEHANVLAAEIAPMVAASWVRDMQTAYTSGLSVESRTALPAPERVPAMVTMASEGVELPAKKALKRGKRG